jgi:hypothetical protein
MYAIEPGGLQEPWAGKLLTPRASPGKPFLPGMAVLAVHLLAYLTNLGRIFELQAGHCESRGGRIGISSEDQIIRMVVASFVGAFLILLSKDLL